jgi:polar amino acid transport system substrate-binding protein
MLRKILSILVVLVVATSMSVDARTLDQIIKDGTIRIGVNPNFPPMSSFSMTNQLEGFDIDIGNVIAEALGAITRTPKRAKVISFTVPLHSEAMGVITTDKIDVSSWTELNNEDITLVNMRGNLSVEILQDKLPKPKVLLVDGNADTIRAIAQGRADALIENVDFFLHFTKNYRNVTWRVLNDTIFVAYCGIGVSMGNDELRNYLNVLLYDLHSSGVINETWMKWYGTPMAVPISPSPYF